MEALGRRRYERSEGHIFRRRLEDSVHLSSVDILVPAYVTKQSTEVEIGGITTIAVGMLSEAIGSATPTEVELVSTDGTRRMLVVPLPSLACALDLKLSAWDARRAAKDAFDVWRCLEVAHARGGPSSKPKVPHSDFQTMDGAGVLAAVRYQGLLGVAANRAAARIVSLIRRLDGAE